MPDTTPYAALALSIVSRRGSFTLPMPVLKMGPSCSAAIGPTFEHSSALVRPEKGLPPYFEAALVTLACDGCTTLPHPVVKVGPSSPPEAPWPPDRGSARPGECDVSDMSTQSARVVCNCCISPKRLPKMDAALLMLAGRAASDRPELVWKPAASPKRPCTFWHGK